MNLRHTKFGTLLIASLVFLFSSCTQNAYYQKQVSIPNAKWSNTNRPIFKFDIKDPSKKHQVYLIVRHDAAYDFNNIWIRLATKLPYEKNFQPGIRINAPLASVSGTWYGKGMGSIWEHKIPLKEGVDFPNMRKEGTYEISLEQVMRVDPLPSVLNVGICVERLD